MALVESWKIPSLVMGPQIYSSSRREKFTWLEILTVLEVSESCWDEASGELDNEEGRAEDKH